MQNKTFIQTIDELKKYIKTNTALDFDGILPDIRNAEQNVIRQLISPEYFDRLLKNVEKLTSDEGEIAELIRYASANLAYYNYIPKANVIMSAAGLKQKHTDTEKPAFQWAVKEFRDAYREQAYQDLDTLLSYLEDNDRKHPIWIKSEAYQEHRSFLITTAREFSKYIAINGSAYLFNSLRPVMKKVEDFRMIALLGDYYKILKENIAKQNTAKQEDELLQMLKPALAYQTMSEAVTQLSIKLSPEGFFTIDTNVTETVVGKKQLTDGNAKRGLEIGFSGAANAYVAKAKNILERNPKIEFPEWYAWKKQEKTRKEGPRFNNESSNGLYAL